MKKHSSLSTTLLSPKFLAIFLGAMSIDLSAQAQSAWNLSTSGTAVSGNWSTGTNWSGGLPTSASDVTFNAPGLNSSGIETITLASGEVAKGITVSQTGATTLTGGTLALGSDGLTLTSTIGGFALQSSILLEASQTWTQASSVSSIQFGAGFVADPSVTTPVTLTFDNTGSGGFDIKNTFKDNSSTGTVAVVFNISAGGITLDSGSAGSNNTGGDTIQAGTVTIKSAVSGGIGASATGNPLGLGTLTFGTGSATSNNISIFANGTYTFANASVVLMSGDATTIQVGSNATAALTGTVSGAGTIAISDASSSVGVFTLSGSNTYSGGTTLEQLGTTGTHSITLILNNVSALGSGALTVTAGTINNTTGAAETLATNNNLLLNGNMGFGTATDTGTNSISFGTGALTIGASRTITFNGTV